MVEKESIDRAEYRKQKGLVIVYTGNGKGKTTAALGMLMRAWGRDMKVAMIQFLKHEKSRYGEIRAAEKMGIEWQNLGDGCTWTSKDMDQTIQLGLKGWETAKGVISSGEYDIIVLDEFTYPLHFGWLDVADIVAWLKANKPEMLHLVITGRDAPGELVAYADLVTEMREIKHPFSEQKIFAQPGVDY